MKVFIIAALTADGFIGQDNGHAADWTGTEDKKVFVRLTKEAGTMIMGSKTLATIGRALPGRRTIVYTNHPEAVTVEGVETTNETPDALLARLAREDVEAVAICGGTTIYDLFLHAGVVNEAYLTYVPQLFGTGVPLSLHPMNLRMELLESTPLSDGSVLCHYRI